MIEQYNIVQLTGDPTLWVAQLAAVSNEGWLIVSIIQYWGEFYAFFKKEVSG